MLHPRKGFALVVTLVLMVLLSILALGLLSLSTVELRNTGNWQKQSQARTNALLALNIAIGELQKNLGPDQRTSANAELLSDSMANPHWVGAWNTQGGFRNWLVSGNENTMDASDPSKNAPAPAHAPSDTLATDKGAILVGENSAGPDTHDHVSAPLVDLKSPKSGNIEGRYAWWVGDEGLKANMAATVEKLPSAASGPENRLKFLASSPNRGFPTLGAPWSKWLPDNSGTIQANTSGKLATRRQIALADPDLSDEEKLRFHDFTVASAGVMADTKHGGLKKDLSIAFEIPEDDFKNSEFTRKLADGELEPDLTYVTNHSGRTAAGPFRGRNTKTAVNYRDPSWSAGNVFRGPTFDLLRDHYQLYRRIADPLSPSANITGQAFLPNTENTIGRVIRGRAPFSDYFHHDNLTDYNSGPNYEVTDEYTPRGKGVRGANTMPRLRPMTTELLPEMIRYTYTIAVQSYPDPDEPGNFKIRFIMTPFMMLHNPYNIELTSPGLWYRIQRAELLAEIAYTDPSGNKGTTRGIDLQRLVESTYGDDARLESDETAQDALDYFVSDDGTPSGTIRMKPGEIKLFTARGSSPIDADALFSRPQNRSMFLQSGLTDLFSTGIYITARTLFTRGSANFTIPAGSKLTFNVSNPVTGQRSRPSKPELGWSANEYHTILSKTVPPGLSEPLPVGANSAWNQIKSMHFFTDFYWTGRINSIIPSTIRVEDIEAVPSGPRRYLGKIDMYLKPSNDGVGRDNNFSLTTHNPRAMIQSPTMTGQQGPASGRGPATWTGSVEALDPATASTPGFQARFWGTGTSLADGGQRNITLFDVPRAPITSMAAFQNANVSRLGNTPAYTIGNSYASPYVPADGLFWRRSDFWIIDHSYVYNEDLFDSYFFSGVNPGHGSSRWNNPLPGSSVSLTSDPTNSSPLQNAIDNWRSGTTPLLNPRIKFSMPDGLGAKEADEELDLNAYSDAQTSLATKSDLRPHNSIAAYTLNEGAFNINSTSVPAWRTLIAGFRGAAIDHLSPGGSMSVSTGNDESPFPRGSLPGADSSIGSDTNLWNGFRSLSDDQIEDLAEEIVTEIKNRARNRPSGQSARPFTTLSEFINRRIESASNPFSLKGPLQAAIDRTTFNNPRSLTNETPIAADRNSQSSRGGATETNAIPFENPAALASSTIAGTPQWFSQADLLERIGPQLSARSDTFTVRTYGESLNAKTGKVEGRAWLEATIQRGSGFVDHRNHPALRLASPELSDENRMFGRRFRVVSFRWLSSKEI